MSEEERTADGAVLGDAVDPLTYHPEERQPHPERQVVAALVAQARAAAVRDALAPLVDGSGREGPADADDPAALLAREVRRQCAEQVRAVATSIEAGNLYDEPLPAAVAKELRTLAASWDEEQG